VELLAGMIVQKIAILLAAVNRQKRRRQRSAFSVQQLAVNR
jgi:hypothetical protein